MLPNDQKCRRYVNQDGEMAGNGMVHQNVLKAGGIVQMDARDLPLAGE